MGKGGFSKTADLKNEKIEVDIYGKRIDVTRFQRSHPGGAKILKIFHQRDATEQFLMCARPRPRQPAAQCPPSSLLALAMAACTWASRTGRPPRARALLAVARTRDSRAARLRSGTQVPLSCGDQEDGADGEDLTLDAGRERRLRLADGKGL